MDVISGLAILKNRRLGYYGHKVAEVGHGHKYHGLPCNHDPPSPKLTGKNSCRLSSRFDNPNFFPITNRASNFATKWTCLIFLSLEIRITFDHLVIQGVQNL